MYVLIISQGYDREFLKWRKSCWSWCKTKYFPIHLLYGIFLPFGFRFL